MVTQIKSQHRHIDTNPSTVSDVGGRPTVKRMGKRFLLRINVFAFLGYGRL